MSAIREREYLEPVLSIVLLLLGFVFFRIIYEGNALASYCGKRDIDCHSSLLGTVIQRSLGILLLGIVPVSVYLIFFPQPLRSFGLNTDNLTKSLCFILGAGIIIIPVIYFASRKPENLERYPQIRKREWNYKLVTINTFSWIGYLLAYEFAFRGFLLHVWIHSAGILPAVIVNTVLYTGVHTLKSRMEAIGSLPFGLILCLVTVNTGNIWFAVFAHLFLALSNDYFSLYFNPQMRMVRKWK